MDLSIIIVNYNTQEITLECLKSIKKNPYQKEFEIILVDNNSSDGSAEYFKNLFIKKSFNIKNCKLKIIKNIKNLGFSAGNNIGIRQAMGKYLLLLNSDTLVTEDALNNLVDFASAHEDAGVIGAKLLNADLTLQPSVFRFPTVIRTLKQYWWNEKGLLDKYAPKNDKASEVEAVVGAAFLITPQSVKKVGLLDEKYFMYFEDLDYCRKVINAGLKVYYLPKVEIIHYHGASGKSLKPDKDQWKRLIPSSKKYHGLVKYYLLTWIMRISQIARKIK